MRKLANSNIYQTASYQAPHDEHKTVMEFEGRCDHDETIFARVEFFNFLLDAIRQTGDLAKVVEGGIRERCRKDHYVRA